MKMDTMMDFSIPGPKLIIVHPMADPQMYTCHSASSSIFSTVHYIHSIGIGVLHESISIVFLRLIFSAAFEWEGGSWQQTPL